MNDAKVDAKTIFLEALDCKGAEELMRFLERECGPDAALRSRVEELLRAHRDAGAFLGKVESQGAMCAQSDAESPGTMIGPYKLLEQIGEGGMGVVFMAEQVQPLRRKVALKVIKPGMDSKQVIARFEAERQALALMDHPNIARVIDAGATESGRPYFVMELVKGISITEYCDQARLTTRQRLELFQRVCLAVQHAHQKGIIHRDLKPGNVLVTLIDSEPVPKVIDFGIAKATGQQLSNRTLFTGFAQMVGSPLYMSPEQAVLSGTDVDTRSDVYSLGVLLYELLTGTTPFESNTLKRAGHDEMRRIIREDEPPRPSTRLTTMEQAALSTICECRSAEPRRLNQQVRGELDWVVMKALEKDRDRRYESASALAADVQRYLSEDAVEACPPSVGYRLRKYVRRNRRLLVPVAVIATVLVAATAVSTWLAVEATAARRDAALDSAITLAVNEFLQGDLLGKVNSVPFGDDSSGNPDLTVKEALDRAAAKIGERFQDKPLVEAAIRSVIAEAYASVHREVEAVAHLERTVALRQIHLGAEHPDTLNSRQRLATLLSFTGHHQEAIELRLRVLESLKARLGPDHLETLACMCSLGSAYRVAGQFDLGVPLLEQLLEKQRANGGLSHPEILSTMHELALTYWHVGRLAESMALHEKLLDGLKSTNANRNESTLWPMLTFAQVCQCVGKFDRADQLLREALEQDRELEDSHGRRNQIANALGWLALNELLQQHYDAAETLARDAMAQKQSELRRHYYWMSLLGAALLGQHKYGEAEPLLLQGYEGMKKLEAMLPALEKRRMAETGERVISFYEATNQPEKARAWREKVKPNLPDSISIGVK